MEPFWRKRNRSFWRKSTLHPQISHGYILEGARDDQVDGAGGCLCGRRTHVQMGNEEQGREWNWICAKAYKMGDQQRSVGKNAGEGMP